MAMLKSMESNLSNAKENKDLTNNLNYTDYREYLLDTLQYMKQLLMPHCGPNASSALLIQEAMDGSKVSEFTKDGITIARLLQFVDPSQIAIQKFVVEMGRLIENHAKDGTTTAMILLCSLMEQLIKTPIDSAPKWVRSLYRNVFPHEFDSKHAQLRQFTDMLKAFVRSEQITCEELAEKANLSLEAIEKYIIIQQAMLSSKGDIELAEALANIISKTPRECRSFYSYYREELETKDRYTVKEVDGLTFTCDITNKDHMNTDNYTAFESEKACVFVVHDGFGINSLSFDYLIGTEENPGIVYKTKDPIVILCHAIDNIVIQAVEKTNKTRDNKIVVFVISPDLKERPYPLAIDVITAYTGLANLENVAFAPAGNYCVRNVKVRYKGRQLVLENLIAPTEDNIHPFYKDKEKHAQYHDLVKWLKSKIQDIAVISNEYDLHERNTCLSGLKSLVQLKKYNLHIGGKALENTQNVSVVEDTYGAVLKVLQEPFVIGGFYSLYLFAKEYAKNTNSKSFIFDCLEDILKTVYTPSQIKEIRKSKYKAHTSLLYNEMRSKDIFEHLSTEKWVHRVTQANLKELFPESDVPDEYYPDYKLDILVHSTAFFTELAKMLEVTCSKLLDTERVLIPNVVIQK